jgi:hypothetical protein
MEAPGSHFAKKWYGINGIVSDLVDAYVHQRTVFGVRRQRRKATHNAGNSATHSQAARAASSLL